MSEFESGYVNEVDDKVEETVDSDVKKLNWNVIGFWIAIGLVISFTLYFVITGGFLK